MLPTSEDTSNPAGPAGLEAALTGLGYPDADVNFETIEQELLKRSDRIRFDDDLTFFEVRLA